MRIPIPTGKVVLPPLQRVRLNQTLNQALIAWSDAANALKEKRELLEAKKAKLSNQYLDTRKQEMQELQDYSTLNAQESGGEEWEDLGETPEIGVSESPGLESEETPAEQLPTLDVEPMEVHISEWIEGVTNTQWCEI